MSMEQQRPRRSRRTISNDDLKDDGGGGGGEGGMQMGGEGQGTNGGGGGRQRMTAPTQQNNRPATRTNEPQTNAADDGTIYEAAGTWTYTVDSPQGGGGTIVLTKTADGYTGTIQRDRAPQATPLQDVKVKGNEVSFTYPVNFGGNSFNVNFKAVIVKDEMTGAIMMGEDRTLNLTAKRKE